MGTDRCHWRWEVVIGMHNKRAVRCQSGLQLLETGLFQQTDKDREPVAVKYRRLQRIDQRLWERLTEQNLQLLADPIFSVLRDDGFRQHVERKLSAKHLVFDALEIQQIDRLLLQFVHTGVATLRGRLQDGYRCRTDTKSLIQPQQYARND